MTFWTIALNDLKLAFKDKMFFFWLFLFPFVFAIIFGNAFRESTPQEQQVSLNILDKDQSALSKSLIQELSGGKYAITLLKNEAEKSYRTLIIPENFSQKILGGEKVELILEKEKDSHMEANQAAYSNTLKAIIKTITRLVVLAPQNQEDLDEKALQQKFERLITLKSERAGKIKVTPSGFNHAIPGISVMFIMFTVLMYGGIIILQERRLGQLERIYLSPSTYASIVGGKWLSRILLGMLQIIILFAAGKILFKIHLGNSILSLVLVAFFFSATIAGLSICLGSFIKKEEILIIINIFTANLMASLGGCWWPLELVPRGLQKLGFIFPTGWAMDAFHKLIFFGYSLESILPHIGILFAFTLVFLFLAIKFFKIKNY